MNKFIRSVYDMAGDEANHVGVGFSVDGTNLELRDLAALEQILPRYFNHNKVASLCRQLNNYGFRKLPPAVRRNTGGSTASTSSLDKQTSTQIFTHPNFQRSRPDLCKLIARQNTSTSSSMNSSFRLSTGGSSKALMSFTQGSVGGNDVDMEEARCDDEEDNDYEDNAQEEDDEDVEENGIMLRDTLVSRGTVRTSFTAASQPTHNTATTTGSAEGGRELEVQLQQALRVNLMLQSHNAELLRRVQELEAQQAQCQCNKSRAQRDSAEEVKLLLGAVADVEFE